MSIASIAKVAVKTVGKTAVKTANSAASKVGKSTKIGKSGLKEGVTKVDDITKNFVSTMMGKKFAKLKGLAFFLVICYMYYLVTPSHVFDVSRTPSNVYNEMPNWLVIFFTKISYVAGIFDKAFANVVHAGAVIVWALFKLFIVAPYSVYVNYISPQVGFHAIEEGIAHYPVSFLIMCAWAFGWLLIYSGIINGTESFFLNGCRIVLWIAIISLIPYIIIGVTGQGSIAEFSIWRIVDVFFKFKWLNMGLAGVVI